MRVAFFCPHSDPLASTGEPDAGGQCVYEAMVASHLAKLGHEARLYTRHWNDKPAHEEIAPGAAVFRYPMGAEGFLRKEDMGPHLAEFTARVLARQGEWLTGADLCHGHYWDGGATALMAALSLGKPLAFTSHSLGSLKREHTPDPSPDGSHFRYDLRIRAESLILNAADGIIALSGNERRALIERYGVAGEKIEIVPGGVDVERFALPADRQALRKQLGFASDFLLLTAGRLDPRKGFLELLDVIPRVCEKLRAAGKNATFCIPAGPERPSEDERQYRQALRAKAERLGISQAIHWFHRLDDAMLKAYYCAADLFLCPSQYEPFGLVLVEAFASGTPVVATCHGGPTEIVSEGLDGHLADPADPEAFGARIVDVLLAPEAARQAMGEAAREKARRRYAWEAVAGAVAQAYRTMLASHRETRPPPGT